MRIIISGNDSNHGYYTHELCTHVASRFNMATIGGKFIIWNTDFPDVSDLRVMDVHFLMDYDIVMVGVYSGQENVVQNYYI